jgi:hypothetical protein
LLLIIYKLLREDTAQGIFTRWRLSNESIHKKLGTNLKTWLEIRKKKYKKNFRKYYFSKTMRDKNYEEKLFLTNLSRTVDRARWFKWICVLISIGIMTSLATKSLSYERKYEIEKARNDVLEKTRGNLANNLQSLGHRIEVLIDSFKEKGL